MYPHHWWCFRNRLYEYRNGFLLVKTKNLKAGEFFYTEALYKKNATCPKTYRTDNPDTLLISLTTKAFNTCKAKV